MKVFETVDDIRPCACWPDDFTQAMVLPDFGKYVHYKCPTCKAGGTETCNVCLGKGFNGHCPKCRGTGEIACRYCLGKRHLRYFYPHFGQPHHFTSKKETANV